MNLSRYAASAAFIFTLFSLETSIAYQLIDDFDTRVNQVTSASDAVRLQPQFIRHEYSRRPAFNADGSLAIMYSSNGFFHLYASNPNNTLNYVRVLDRIGGGVIEPNWHPSDPNLLYTFNGHGIGMQLNVFDVRDQRLVNAIDMASKINALGGGFTTADRAFTGEEGRPSQDGNIWCLAVYSGEEWSMRGMVAYDIALDQVVAFREMTEGPDAISTSVNGKYCLSISGYNGSGIRSYPIEDSGFGTFRQIHQAPEHVDLALDATGRDVLVYIDSQNDGYVKAIDLETGKTVRFFDTWDTSSPPAAHFSGLGYSQPGWVVVSMFGGNPSSFYHNKILAVEIAENPTIIILADNLYSAGGYWGQPQATVNHQLNRVLFSSNFSGNIADYMISLDQTLPAARGILETTRPDQEEGGTTPESFALETQPIVLFQQDGNITIVVKTPVMAQCRWDYSDGSIYAYEVLYQDMDTDDGLTHVFNDYSWNDHDLYVVCRTSNGVEANQLIQVQREVLSDTPTLPEPEDEPIASPAGPLQITGDTDVSFQRDGDITFTVQTSIIANCRWDYADGSTYAYDVLYQDLTTNDGLIHSFSEYVWNDHEVYVVCKSSDDAEASQLIQVQREMPSEPPTLPEPVEEPTASPVGPLQVTGNTDVSFQEDGSITFTVQTSIIANCRWDYADGSTYAYDVLYQDLTTNDGLIHSFSEYVWNDHEVYVVCKSSDDVEASQLIQVQREMPSEPPTLD